MSDQLENYEDEVLSTSLPDQYSDEVQSDLSSSMLSENLLNQIQSATEIEVSPVDYLNPIMERFDYLLERYQGTELESDLADQKINFLVEISITILNTFGVENGEELLTLELPRTLQIQTEALYNFFFTSRSSNITNAFVNYIFENTESLARELKKDINRKDFGVAHIRKQVKEYDHAVLLMKLPDAVSLVPTDDFLNLVMKGEEDRVDNIQIREMMEILDTSTVSEIYFDEALNPEKIHSAFITNEVRNSLFELFKTPITETEDGSQ